MNLLAPVSRGVSTLAILLAHPARVHQGLRARRFCAVVLIRRSCWLKMLRKASMDMERAAGGAQDEVAGLK
jgi:hypothetical protein